MMKKYCSVKAGEERERVDLFLSSHMEGFTRNAIQRLLGEDKILLRGEVVKKNYKVQVGDEFEITIDPPKTLELEAQNIPLDILYEDRDLLVLNKARGMVVHPAPGHHEGTLVHALLYHVKDLSDINGVLRPGIVHRMDKLTTGLLMVTKNNEAHQYFSKLFKKHDLLREYTALVYGRTGFDERTIDAPLARNPKDRKSYHVDPDGRRAITHVRTLERWDRYSLVACRLETGRTHQIRVHLKSIGHPILGDEVYGPKKGRKLGGQMLHASKLGFLHPKGEYMEFEAALPEDFQEILNKLRK